MNQPADFREVRSACPYCGVGCGVVVESAGDRILNVRGDAGHSANRGRLCSKGASLHLTTEPAARVLHPELRRARTSIRARASWDDALDLAADRFAAIVREHGPDSVAFYVSGQLLTEDYYVFNKLVRGLVGTNNIDTNSRLCMASAVTGYKAAFGVDAPPACYDDIEAADCILIAGANPAFAHPVLFRRLEAARAQRPEQRLIVVDPRLTDSAAAADLHLPITPGSDVALFNAMLHVLLWEGLVDREYIRDHTSGFDALRAAVAEYTPGSVAAACGVAADDIVKAARWFGEAGASLSLWCQGLNQSVQGTDKNVALLNLHLATGHIGRPGAGPLSLTGQPNAMGGREVGGLATALSAHRDPANPEDRAEIAAFWGVPQLPARPGLTAVEMFETVRAGSIKALWIACTNPAQSLPHQARVRDALERAEFVVLQEAFRNTETTRYADVLLPAAPWGEKDGTQTNSERTITRVRPSIPVTGEARADWRIATDFSHRLGVRLGRAAEAQRLFPYTSPDQIFDEHRATTRGRDLDITGLDYALLEEKGPQQWPFPAGAASGAPRLYADGRFATPDGRARFTVVHPRKLADPTNARHPLHLTTGRLRDQWHGMSRTGFVAQLYGHESAAVLEMNEGDMTRRGLRTDDIVRVSSRQGSAIVPVRAAPGLRPGLAFLPMHWGGARLGGLGVNAVTIAAVDPKSRQPEFKHAAVQVERMPLPWMLVAMRAGSPGDDLPALAPFLEHFTYAQCGLAGRDHPVVILRAACAAAPDEALLQRLDAVLGLDDDSRVMAYRDPRRGIGKRVLVEGGRVTAARLSGETAARDWLQDLIADRAEVSALRGWVLAPIATPPSGAKARGRVVCRCLNVAATELESAIAAGADFDALQSRLRCGTQCGSCVPEVKRMVAQARTSEERAEHV